MEPIDLCNVNGFLLANNIHIFEHIFAKGIDIEQPRLGFQSYYFTQATKRLTVSYF